MHSVFSNRGRKIVISSMAAGLLLLVSACSSSSKDASGALDPNADLTKQSLVVSNWAAYNPPDLAATFEKAIGAKMTITNHATNEEIMAKLTSGADSGIDVAFVSGQYAQALAAQGLLEPIDTALIPNLSNLYPEASKLAYDIGNKYSVPYTWGTTGICYRKDLTGFDPTSWNDLLNPAANVKGKTTMLATERWLMLPAQKLLGISANSTDEAEMAKVKAQLIATKKTLLAYDDTTFYTRLVSGEASMVEAWDGWCNYGITDNKNIKFVIPKEGSDLWVDTMVILKTSKNKEAAHAFINYILDPAVNSWVISNVLYKTPDKAAMELTAAKLGETYPNMLMTPTELLKGEGLNDLGTSGPMYTKIATEVTSSK